MITIAADIILTHVPSGHIFPAHLRSLGRWPGQPCVGLPVVQQGRAPGSGRGPQHHMGKPLGADLLGKLGPVTCMVSSLRIGLTATGHAND